jgi:hypothetical protein
MGRELAVSSPLRPMYWSTVRRVESVVKSDWPYAGGSCSGKEERKEGVSESAYHSLSERVRTGTYHTPESVSDEGVNALRGEDRSGNGCATVVSELFCDAETKNNAPPPIARKVV